VNGRGAQETTIVLPRNAKLPACVTGKQANALAAGRGWRPGRLRLPWRVALESALAVLSCYIDSETVPGSTDGH